MAYPKKYAYTVFIHDLDFGDLLAAALACSIKRIGSYQAL